MLKKINNFLINLSILVVYSIICIVGLEIGFRYFSPQRLVSHYDGLYMTDNMIGYKLRPGWSGISSSPEYQHKISINSAGFYDDEFNKKDDNCLRIVLLGDSFIFDVGNPYGKRLSEVLEGRLNSMDLIQKKNKKVDVLNMGINGYDPYRYLLTWNQIGRRYNPTIVLLGFFAGNDYIGAPERIIPQEPKSQYNGLKAVLYPINEFLESQSHLYILSRTSLESIRIRLGLSDKYLPKILTDPERAVNDVLPVIKKIAEEFKDGPPLLIFQIPDRSMVDEKFAKIVAGVSGIPPEKLMFDAIPKAFRTIAFTARSTSFVDLQEEFKKNGGGKLFFPIDGHWNSEGVMVAAEVLLPEIKKILISQLANDNNLLVGHEVRNYSER